jgi:hypothetical protein
MSEGENFVARWSRRKRQAAQDAQATTPAPAPASEADAERLGDTVEGGTSNAGSPEASGQLPDLPFDIASLPPLESISAESDIRAFLAPGVPPELTRAALRRVWTADPTIRDFVGLAENAWDFNAPDSIAGFGTLEMTDELRRQVARIVGNNLSSEERDAPAPTLQLSQHPAIPEESSGEPATAARKEGHGEEEQRNCQEPSLQSDHEMDEAAVAIARDNITDFAAQHIPAKPDKVQAAVKPSHGRALPE